MNLQLLYDNYEKMYKNIFMEEKVNFVYML